MNDTASPEVRTGGLGPGIYLDHASSTPVCAQAQAAMAPWLGSVADPGRVHSAGRVARAAVEDARDAVGAHLGVRPRDVVFCASGTEALNWAVFAACGLTPKSRGPWGSAIVVATIEHTAVRDAARLACAKAGLDLIEWDVDADGVTRIGEVPDGCGLVALQAVNHETGVVQPVAAAADAAHAAGARLLVDACSAVGGVALPGGDVADLTVISGHKLGGPAGTAALGLGRRLRLDPLFVGGEQELLRRAGGENVAGIVGLGAAVAAPWPDLIPVRDRLVAGLQVIDGVEVLGLNAARAPHLVCATVPGLKGEALLIGLDRAGVWVNSGSSCSAERLEPSHVLAAMGADADASLRFSFGRHTVAADIDAALAALAPLVAELRRYGGFAPR